MSKPYQPKTGERCHCKPGQHRDNCPDCEGTGWKVDFRAIRARSAAAQRAELEAKPVPGAGLPTAHKFTDSAQPPVCLHILGQDLANALHAEAMEYRRALETLLETVESLSEIHAITRSLSQRDKARINRARVVLGQEPIKAWEVEP